MSANKGILLLILPSLVMAEASRPKWITASPAKNGNSYSVVCHADGPGVDSARSLALQDCKRSAVEMKTSTTRTKTLIVETESSASLHQETEMDATAQHVVCDPRREFVDDSSGFVQIWIECVFDLEKIEIDPNGLEKSQASKPIVNVKTSITVGTTPRCESIVVVGKSSNVVKCESNPTQVIIDGTTTDVIIRARGYQPYHLGSKILSEGIQDAYNIFLSK